MVILLAVSICAATTIFSFAKAILVQPLPYRRPDRLVWIWGLDSQAGTTTLSIPDFLDFQANTRSLVSTVAFQGWSANITGRGEAERVQGMRVSPGFFDTIGVRAVLGRGFGTSTEVQGDTRVVVIAQELWRRRFGSDPGVVGKYLTLDGTPYIVAGLLPPDFVFPIWSAEFAVPRILESDPARDARGTRILFALGRLASEVTIEQVEQEMCAIAEQLRVQYPDTNARQVGVKLISVQEQLIRNVRSNVVLLVGAVASVMLISWANVSHLLLARGMTRRREVAIRRALGARRPLLSRQFFLEGLLIAGTGGMVGFVIAHWVVDLARAWLAPLGLPLVSRATVDSWIALVSAGLVLLTAAIMGVAVGWGTARLDLVELLKSPDRAATRGGGARGGWSVLVIAQVALSLLLMTASVALMKALRRVQAVEGGFDAENVLTMSLSPTGERYAESDQVMNFYDEVLRRIGALPGVVATGVGAGVPVRQPLGIIDFSIVGRPPVAPEDVPAANYSVISPGYFEAMGIVLLDGRDVGAHDDRTRGGVVLVDRAMSDRFWRGRRAVGEYLDLDDSRGGPRRRPGVGVTENVSSPESISGPPFHLYVPLRQVPESSLGHVLGRLIMVVKTSSDSMNLLTSVRNQVLAIDADVPTSKVATVKQLISMALAPKRLATIVVGTFAWVALALASFGIYSVVYQFVIQRTREIGIRVALGARPREVLRMVMTQGFRLVLAGVIVGGAVAPFVSRVAAGVGLEMGGAQGGVLLASSTILIVVGLLASYSAARAATRVDPAVALRDS